MSTQQVIVKAYYNDLAEKQPEIRRFTVSLSWKGNPCVCLLKFFLSSSTFRPTAMFIKHWKQPLPN